MSNAAAVVLEGMSDLCKVGVACMNGEPAFYPGSSLFIDPAGMTPWQLFFTFLVYGYVLYISADMIGDGAELLLLVPGYADMVGSIVLPILGAIPDGMIVLFSGMGPLAIAQENVAVGVGGLAGSTIMLLTLPWLLSVRAAQVDMNDKGEFVGYKAKPGKRSTAGKPQGCQFNDGVTKNAWIMLLTSLSYFVIQFPALTVDDQKTKEQLGDGYLEEVMKESKGEHLWAGIGAICTLALFTFYMVLQYLAATKKSPGCLKSWLPADPIVVPSMELVKMKGLSSLVAQFRDNYKTTGNMKSKSSLPWLSVGAKKDAENNPQLLVETAFLGHQLPKELSIHLKKLYPEYAAKSKTGSLDEDDVRKLLHNEIGMRYKPENFTKLFKVADNDAGGTLDLNEFLGFFFKMLTGDEDLPWETGDTSPSGDGGEGGEDEDEAEEMPDDFKDLPLADQQSAIMKESVKGMLIGTLLVLVFSDPMVDVLAQIGVVTGVPTFYVSFVLAPLASNASELVSSMKLASKKTSSSLTQSLQTLIGAACMNNTFCLGIFLFLIYYQGLAWKFTAETLTIFLVQFLVFLIVIASKVQTMKTGVLIFLMYPVSLVFVFVLEKAGLD